MSDNKTPVDAALDLLLYAPIGLVLEARNLVPQLAERGRQQVTMARMVGQFAVRQGQKHTSRALAKVGEQASAVLSDVAARDPAACS